MSTQEIRERVLQLPAADRASLARDLLESLDPNEPDENVEAAWIDEIESRAEAYHAGQVSADDWEVSLARARKRLSEGDNS